MKSILVLGAGRSSSTLIQYLLSHASEYNWKVTVGDALYQLAEQKVAGHPCGEAIQFDIQQTESTSYIHRADVVVSLLPPMYHPLVAVLCLKHIKHLVTASYVSEEMQALHDEASQKGLIFLNECGLDPGLDHMSAMQVIDKIKENGGTLSSFESFTGGLIAPDTDPENPWRYKFTWNPKNVVMAGQGTAKFLQDGRYRYIPYQQLFQRITSVSVPNLGEFEGYANRDSLKYLKTYNLEGVKTILRGTLRNKGFCSAWNVLVQLGCCDDHYLMEGVEKMTHAQFLESFLSHLQGKSIIEKLSALNFVSGNDIAKLKWSGFFDDELIGLCQGTPAGILEHILNKKWALNTNDKDQVVMWHRFVYWQENQEREIQSSLVASGENSIQTAMAKTVGLPLGIATKLIVNGKIRSTGVSIPTRREIYDPVLKELSTLGIQLDERQLR
jgi:saccharopine dehydrogenase-like NADP-dependent oxidoreductase